MHGLIMKNNSTHQLTAWIYVNIIKDETHALRFFGMIFGIIAFTFFWSKMNLDINRKQGEQHQRNIGKYMIERRWGFDVLLETMDEDEARNMAGGNRIYKVK